MIVLYIIAYLAVGATAVKILDRLSGSQVPKDIAAFVLIFWPLFTGAGLMALVVWVFVPDIFDRDTLPVMRCPPQPTLPPRED